ncbi:MAG TPA: dihydrolipoamide acetyltransferase family protein [Gaiellales bacterium]|jgi:pyruvate dehydrogenase E2 component (dihydrolipoamide acetyltransferase)|nr:dihydrolipoamide acetyltransferase family protein [Gaiellales bacterium]
MSEELTMPRLSDTMEQGTIGRWLKREGESFHEGDVIAEIETDKATMDFQAYEDGTMLRILVADGESAPLGAPIAIIGAEGEEVPDDAPAAASANGDGGAEKPAGEGEAGEPEPQTEEQAPVATATEAAPSNGAPADGGGLRASPIARRMANAGGLDLCTLAGKGTGPDGRIVKADVERALASGANTGPAAPGTPQAAPQPPGEGDEVRELTPMLKAVARRMAESKASVPHFYVSSEIDMTRALELRAELNEALADSGEKVSVNDLIVRACAQALLQHPQAHRSYVDGHHVYHAHANIGIAVALDDGLIVPVLRDADSKGVRQLAVETRDLVTRARDGKLRQSEIEGGTFTVSNMGMFDVAAFSAIINPPESTILAVSSTVERAVVRDGAVVPRKIMSVTLSCDHRACSGADGARLLQTVKRHLEAPTLLLA